jgi:hypothetical protein
MSWKHYVAGIATAAGIAGAVYLETQFNNLRGENVVGSTEVDDVTIRVIEQDKKWAADCYRIEILDKKGNVRVQFQGNGHRFGKAEIKNEGGLETSIDF